MSRGGRRSGQPGVAYPNRSDLNRVGPSKVYGEAIAQERAMAAVPVAPSPMSGGGGGGGGSNTNASTTTQNPPAPLPDLFAPTLRPDEPLTSGAPVGPGPNSLPMAAATDPVVQRLRAIYQVIPSESLRELLEDLEDELGI